MQRIRKILVLLATIMMLWSSTLSVEASSFRFKVTAEKEEVKAGDIVKLNLKVSEIDVKEGINVLEADLQYDETVFEKVTFQDNNEWNSVYHSEEGEHKGKILFAKAIEGVRQEEKIGEIQLKLKNNVKDQETEIQINHITSNDGKQLIEEENKCVKIKIADQKNPEQDDKKEPEQSDKKEPEQGDKKEPEQSDEKDLEQDKEKDDTEKVEQDLIKTTYEQKNKGSAKEEENNRTEETIGEDIKTGDGILLLTIAVIVLIIINVIYFIIKSKQLGKAYRKRMLILIVVSLVLIIVVAFLAKDVLAFEGKELEEMIQFLKSENKNNPESTEYLVTDQIISRIKPNTTTEVVKSKLENVTIVNSLDTENVKTGMTAKYETNGRTYEISVLGDINGDGILNQIELTRVIREYLKCENWRIEKEVERKSADVTCDGKIDEKDVSSIIHYIMYGKLEAKEVEPVIAPKVEVIEGKKTEEGNYVARVMVKITQQNEEDKTQKTIYEITGSKKTEETIMASNEAMIELTGAGVYKITGYTYGKDGNKSKGSDLIVVIEELPEIEVSTQEWTNQKVQVTMKEKEGYAIEYKFNEGEWTTYKGKLEIEENCSITARFVNLTNEDDKSKSVTTQITNIDSKTPTGKIEEVEKRSNTVKVKVQGQDEELSGIHTIKIHVKESTEETYNCVKTYEYGEKEDYSIKEETYDIEGLKADTIYKIYTEVIDQANNVYTTKEEELEVKTLKEPDLTINVTPTEATKDKVTATITMPEGYEEEGYGMEYVLSQEEITQETEEGWTAYQKGSMISTEKNTTIYARPVKGETKEKITTKEIFNIDQLAPIDFKPTTTSTTNKIVLEGSTKDAEATKDYTSTGIEKYYFSKDDGVTWEPINGQTQSSYTFENLTQTQEYNLKMKAVDQVGNERVTANITETTKTVPKLDESNVKFVYSNTNWTNSEQIEVTIQLTDDRIKDHYTLEYSMDGTTWEKYTKSIKMQDNGKIYARVIDSTNQTGNNKETGYATGTVSNFDRIEPNLATITLSSTRVIVGGEITANVLQSDLQSGVATERSKWVFTTDGDEIGTTASNYTGGTFISNPEEITLRGVTPGTFYLHILTEDEAGNQKETVSEAITIVAKVLPKVGDYVAYTPQKTTTSYNFEAKYTGFTSDQEISQEDLQWRVLSVNNNKVELISKTQTSEKVTFKEALGYNNGVYLLDDFCNTLYGNTTKRATARSLKIEDIQNKLDLDVWDYHNYETATNTRYGEVYNFTDKRAYPYQWTQERNSNSKIDGNKTTGILGMSEQRTLTEETSAMATTSIEAQQTEWRIRTEASNFINEMYYQLLINPGTSNKTSYTNWLSSRMVYASGSDNAGFGLASIKYNWVDHDRLYYSAGYGSKLSENIRPVVTIPLNEIDTSTDYETTGIWNLK